MAEQRKLELTSEQDLKVDEELKMKNATSSSEQSQNQDDQCVVNVGEASPISKPPIYSPSSCSKSAAYSSPVTNPALLTSETSTDVTSPSLRYLNPGTVSSLAKYWTGKWKKKKECKEDHDHKVQDTEGLDHVLDLKAAILTQSELLRKFEEENGKLKSELAQYKTDVTIVKENYKSCACVGEIVELREEIRRKDCQIYYLQDKLNMAIDNLETSEKNTSNGAGSEATELKNAVLETRLNEYEEVIRDIKNQIIPTEDLKSKIDSLDQDVICLRRKLQCRGSFKYKKKTAVLPSKANKRKSISKLDYCAMPAKMIKLTNTELKPEKEKVNEVSEDSSSVGLMNINLKVEPESLLVINRSSKHKGKFEDCKQQ